MPVVTPSLRRIFDRIAGKSEDIDRAGALSYFKGIGIGGGFFGAAKVAKGADAFLSTFDTNPTDGKVSWEEFTANSATLLPAGLTDSDGKLDPARVSTVFGEIAGAGKKKATEKDVARYARSKIKGKPALVRDLIAEASAKIALDALDVSGSQSFRLADLEALVKDINQKLA